MLGVASGAVAPVRPGAHGGLSRVGLGTAQIAGGTRWATPPAAPQPARPAVAPIWQRRLRVPAHLLARMALAAESAGRSEEEVWIEAAAEWLARRAAFDEPPPSAPAAAPRPAHAAESWQAIDAVLAELRAPRQRTAAHERQPLPPAA